MAADTWAEALRDPHVPIHWLLEIGGTGTFIRYADSPLHIGSVHYAGGLRVTVPPGCFVDPYTSAPSTPNAVVMLQPVRYDPADPTSARPMDIEETYRKSLLELTAKLYLWAEGTPRSEATLRIYGFVHAATLDADGNLMLTIVDRLLKYNRALPRYFVNEITWPSSYDDDQGSGYPILFGTFTRVVCPVVLPNDGGYDYALVADGTIASITEAYLDDDDTTTETLVTATDAKDRTVSRARFTRASDTIGDKQVTVSGTGYADTVDGRYSGTSSALLTHPADQLWYAAETFAGVRESEIDTQSFKALRVELSNWSTAPQVLTNESTSFDEMRHELSLLMRSAIYPEQGRLTARHLNFKRAPVLALVEGENVRAVNEIGWGDKKNLITQLILKYQWGYVPKVKQPRWKKTIDIGPDDFDGFAANRNILRGVSNVDIEKQRKIEARSVQDKTTAGYIADLLCELHERPRKIVNLWANRDAHNLKIYDVVTLTLNNAPSAAGTGWVRQRAVLIGIAYGTDECQLTLLEA